MTKYSDLRLIVYAIPLLCLLWVTFDNSAISVRRSPAIFVCVLFAAVIGSVVTANVYSVDALRHAVFLTMSIAMVWFYVPGGDKAAQWALGVLSLGTFLLYAAGNAPAPSIAPYLFSNGFAESSYGLTAGAIAVYFYHRRNYLWLGLSGLATLVMYKRVAILALIIVIAANELGVVRLLAASFWCRLLAAFLFLVVGLNVNAIALWFLDAFHIGGSIDAYMLGRYTYNATLGHVIDSQSWLQQLLGNGPGAAERALSSELGGKPVQPHNDFLRVRVDYGWIGLVALLAATAALFDRGALGAKLFLFQLILFLTDNTLIYVFHFVVLSVLLGSVAPPVGRPSAPVRRA